MSDISDKAASRVRAEYLRGEPMKTVAKRAGVSVEQARAALRKAGYVLVGVDSGEPDAMKTVTFASRESKGKQERPYFHNLPNTINDQLRRWAPIRRAG